MNEEAFRQLATSFVEPFLKYGFSLVEQEYWPKDFGNAVATYEDDFRLRLVNDKGQLFVDVGPKDDPDEWYDLRLVLKFLGETVDMQGVDEENLDQLRVSLDAKYETIRSLFSRDNFASTKPQLDEFRNQRVAKLFGFG